GASRTSTAMQRFVAYNRPEDVFVIVNGSADETPVRLAEARARLLALPQVRDATRRPYIFMSPDREGAELGAVSSFAAADAHAFRTMNRPLVVRGRLPRVDSPPEAMIDDVTARIRHLHVGSRVTMWAYTLDQLQAA